MPRRSAFLRACPMIRGGSAAVQAGIGTRNSTPFSLNAPSGLLLVDQHLRMVDVERRVEQVVVLKVVAHCAGRLIFDAVGDALVAGRFGRRGGLEPVRRRAHSRDVAIDGVAKPAWKHARRLAHVRGACLRHGRARQRPRSPPSLQPTTHRQLESSSSSFRNRCRPSHGRRASCTRSGGDGPTRGF